MPKLPHLSGSEIIRALERLGFVQVRQKGSHVVLKRDFNWLRCSDAPRGKGRPQRIEGFRIESTTFKQPDLALLRITCKFSSEPEWRTEGFELGRMPDGWRRVIGIGEARRVAAIIGFRKQ